jgi:hypothetical protein
MRAIRVTTFFALAPTGGGRCSGISWQVRTFRRGTVKELLRAVEI